jgi:tetratricopeptide (TPR) repeat protein
MNLEFVAILKKLMAEYGDSLLFNQKRVSGLLGDLAQNIPTLEKKVFLECLASRRGYVQILKDAAEAERAEIKQKLAQRLHEEEGLVLDLCAETVDLLSMVLCGEEQKKNLCKNCKKELQEGWSACPYCGTMAAVEAASVRESANSTAQALVESGEAFYLKGQFDEARRDCTEAIRLDPNYAKAYQIRGDSFRRKFQFDEAIKDCNEAIRLDPNDAKAYRCRGDSYRGKKQYDEAIRDHNEAIRIDPSCAIAYSERGAVYYEKGQDDEAIKDYTEAIRLDPQKAMVYRRRGNSYRMKNQYDEAIKDYTEAIRLDPNYSNAYCSRGATYRLLDLKEKAMQDLVKALAIDPDNSAAKEEMEKLNAQ